MVSLCVYLSRGSCTISHLFLLSSQRNYMNWRRRKCRRKRKTYIRWSLNESYPLKHVMENRKHKYLCKYHFVETGTKIWVIFKAWFNITWIYSIGFRCLLDFHLPYLTNQGLNLDDCCNTTYDQIERSQAHGPYEDVGNIMDEAEIQLEKP